MEEMPQDGMVGSMGEGSALTPTPEEKGWLVGLHLSPLAMFTSIPFANAIAPLVIWLIKKDTMPILNMHGKEVLNFQISICIYAAVAIMLCFVLIGFFLLPAIGIFNLIMTILGAIDAN